MTKPDELELTPDVLEAKDAYELFRFWVVDNEDAVIMNVGMFGDKEPEVWGTILADVSRHCVRALCLQDPGLDPKVIRAQMENSYASRLKEKDGTSGAIGDLH